MKMVHYVALVLVIVGALNWGLVGAANFNLVDTIFGAGSMLSRVVYVLVGISGLVVAGTTLAMHKPVRP